MPALSESLGQYYLYMLFIIKSSARQDYNNHFTDRETEYHRPQVIFFSLIFGLPLPLYSGINPGRVQGMMWGARDQTQVSLWQGKHLAVSTTSIPQMPLE